jgi:hypothetical protein
MLEKSALPFCASIVYVQDVSKTKMNASMIRPEQSDLSSCCHLPRYLCLLVLDRRPRRTFHHCLSIIVGYFQLGMHPCRARRYTLPGWTVRPET